jgi:TRAP-type C4-dicarboxylate transport system permease small subunit
MEGNAMRLSTVAQRCEKALYEGSRILNWVGVAVLAFMMLMTVCDVTGRRVFNNPLPNVLELSEALMVIVVMFAMADCASRNGHVVIEVLVDKFPKKYQTGLYIFGCLIGLFVFALIFWQTLQSGFNFVRTGESRGVLHIPVFPFVFAFTLGALYISLILLAQIISTFAREVFKCK